jgi:hypothetical protein
MGGMTMVKPRYSREEFARRGDAIYDRDIAPRMKPDDRGKLVAIDIETGDFEVDTDELTASDRLFDRHPEAQVWLRRVGSRYVDRIGAGTHKEDE